VLRGYRHSLAHSRLVLVVFLSAIALNVVLIKVVPKGFFPEEDTGRLIGHPEADQSVSFHAMMP